MQPFSLNAAARKKFHSSGPTTSNEIRLLGRVVELGAEILPSHLNAYFSRFYAHLSFFVRLDRFFCPISAFRRTKPSSLPVSTRPALLFIRSISATGSYP